MYGIIYKATNKANGKVYIGKTTRTLDCRIKEHKSDSKNNHYNAYFHNVIRKYGFDIFDWCVIDNASNEDDLNKKEIFWIDYYNSYAHSHDSNGYNLTLGGEGSLVWDIYKIEREIRKIMKELKINHSPNAEQIKYYNSPLLPAIGSRGGILYLSKLFNIPPSPKRIRYWSNEDIESEIVKISNKYFDGRFMPNRKDILSITGNDSLNHVIVSRGGYKYWADKLNLKLQNNNSIIQHLSKEHVGNILKNLNVNNLTEHRSFFILNEEIKIFVSCTIVDNSSGREKYKFHIKSKENSDINILCAFNNNEEIVKTFILPHNQMSKAEKIEIRENSKYSVYENKWDILLNAISITNNSIKGD